VHSASPIFGSQRRFSLTVGVVFASAALAGTLMQLGHGGGPLQPGPGGLDWVSGLLAVCASAPLVAWAFAPRAVFVVSALVMVAMAGLGYGLALPLAPTGALFLLTLSGDDEGARDRQSIALVLVLFAAYVIASALGSDELSGVLLHTGLAWAVAWFAGERVRLRHQHFNDLRDRALRVERDAERERQLAAAEERARIARDLHDSVGHAINVIAVRAGAARLRHAEDPDRTIAALEAIEHVARETAEDIDQIVGALRDESAPERPAATPIGLASAAALVEHHWAAGLDVTVETHGHQQAVGQPTDQAAYRILQEALTNAARHGTGVARLELDFQEDALELAVSNPVPAGYSMREDGGHGLVGMRERATLLGGEFDARRHNGAFRLRARLPYTGIPR
jgi:signal transduction histidine kinase